MTRGQLKDGFIELKQQKTGEALVIPVHPALERSLENLDPDQLVIVTTQAGRPRTAKGFGNWISEAADKAGLTGCTAHGLRKSAARRLAEAGCSAHQIMSITGHRSLKEVDRYTRSADQKHSAQTAIEMVQRTQRERKIV